MSLDKLCVVFMCAHIFGHLVYLCYSSAWVNGLSLPWAVGFQPGSLFPVVFPRLQCWPDPLQDPLSLNSITHAGPGVSSPTETSTYMYLRYTISATAQQIRWAVWCCQTSSSSSSYLLSVCSMTPLSFLTCSLCSSLRVLRDWLICSFSTSHASLRAT